MGQFFGHLHRLPHAVQQARHQSAKCRLRRPVELVVIILSTGHRGYFRVGLFCRGYRWYRCIARKGLTRHQLELTIAGPPQTHGSSHERAERA